jgi:hypothetical protein
MRLWHSALKALGNKAIENLVLELDTKNPIDTIEVEPQQPQPLTLGPQRTHLHLSMERLNPSQELLIFLTCTSDPSLSQRDHFSLTHSEGAAKPANAPTSGATYGIAYSILWSLLGVSVAGLFLIVFHLLFPEF